LLWSIYIKKRIFYFSLSNKILKENAMSRKVEVAGIMGPLWFMGWLFTIGFLKVSFFKGLLALFIWPYYIGEFLSRTQIQ
jgi:hypothetical protein